VFAGFVENQAAWPIGQIDAGLFEQRRRGFEPGVSNRQDMVAHGSVKGPGHGLGAFDRSEERDASAPLRRGCRLICDKGQARCHGENVEQFRD